MVRATIAPQVAIMALEPPAVSGGVFACVRIFFASRRAGHSNAAMPHRDYALRNIGLSPQELARAYEACYRVVDKIARE